MGSSTKKQGTTYTVRYLLTVVASDVAEFVTFPLDITKTRLQVQGQLNCTAPYRGMTRTALGIIHEEGFLKLWRGIPPALFRHCFYSSRVLFYEIIRKHIFKRDKNGRYPLWKSVPSAMIAGVMGQFLASPTDLVKIRLQVEGKRLLEGHPPRHRGMWDAFQSIVRSNGIRGLWNGWVPNCQRAALVCLGGLTTYDITKQMILRNTRLEDGTIAHTMSSACAGLVASILSTPADVIKSRMMSQGYENGRGIHYSSTLQCIHLTVRGEGFLALYKGFFPTWIRLGPFLLTFWIVYEEIRVLAGISTF